EIIRLLQKINRAWVEGRPEELGEYFHEKAVIVHPGFQGRSEGREACVSGYRDFISRAEVREYRETGFAVDLWGDTAVASYQFEIAYAMGGKEYRESGRDLFVFTREGGRWLAAWRTLFPTPA
ncbi:MAG: nuclear transport factor 2 family protein, partial [Candidatus Glassbacteria bacterium]|nr:nuclear transport factor 2 family protein [Candidatus Glassbacteria bacterium]